MAIGQHLTCFVQCMMLLNGNPVPSVPLCVIPLWPRVMLCRHMMHFHMTLRCGTGPLFFLLSNKTRRQSHLWLWAQTRGGKGKGKGRGTDRIMGSRKETQRTPPREIERTHMGREGDHHWSRRRRGWRSRLPAPRWSGNPGTSPASLSSGIHPRSLLTHRREPAACTNMPSTCRKQNSLLKTQVEYVLQVLCANNWKRRIISS